MTPQTARDRSPCPPDCPQCQGRGWLDWPVQGIWHRMPCSAFAHPAPAKFPKESNLCNSFSHARKMSRNRSV
jgi:hypothetical protein